jgi:hypothetical protein
MLNQLVPTGGLTRSDEIINAQAATQTKLCIYPYNKGQRMQQNGLTVHGLDINGVANKLCTAMN